MVSACDSVEVSRSHEDSTVGEPADGLPARLASGHPQVQPCLAVVDGESAVHERCPQDLSARKLALALNRDVIVIVKRGCGSGLNRRGNHHSEVLANTQHSLNDFWITGHEPEAIASEVRALRQ